MSELRDQGTDLPRETGLVVRNGSGAGDVPLHAGDNPTMSLSELYERRDQREGVLGAETPAEGQGAAVSEDVRGTEASASEGTDVGYPAYEAGYPADAGAPNDDFDANGANEVIDGQVVSDPVTDSDPVPDWEAGNWDPPAEPVSDARPMPNDGGRGADDSRFAGWPDREAGVAAADDPYDREGPVGGQEADGSPGFFGRAGELQDQGEAESGEREGDERAGPGTRTNADTSQQGERGEEVGGEKDAEGQGEDGQEQRSRDLARVQHLAPDAEMDRSAETSAEAAPDQQPDDPRLAAMERQMERMMATVEAMQEKLEASEARNDALEASHQAETAQLRKEIDELKALRQGQGTEAGRTPGDADQPELSGFPDDTDLGERQDLLGLGDDVEPADIDTVNNRILDRTAREDNAEPDKPERSRYSEESMELFKSAAGVLKSAGVSVPGMDLVLGGDDTRRAIEKMEPEAQNDTMNMAYTAGLAFSSLPPATAVAAFGVSAVIPVVRDRFGDIVGKWRGKD